jgi:spermidine/putrescine transport system substrate-binding protein
MVEIMRNEGLLDSYTREEMPNFGNIAPEWVDAPFDPGRKHSIRLSWAAIHPISRLDGA